LKIHNVEQLSIEWAKLHIGIVTASEFGQLVSPTLKIRDGEMPKTLLYKKTAEVYRGEPMCNLTPGFSVAATEQGLFLEEEARPWFALTYDVDVKTAGFCTHDNGLAGCSPDGLVGEDEGLEIKSPEPQTHCRWLIGGELPAEHAPQVHFSLYVTGRARWRFVSYRRRFPALVVTVERDETIMAMIDGVVNDFHAKLETAVSKLRSLK
jgi:YqaJ-like viral recombinase domain